jgi:tetratricopeptide (TPR) repeat protein
MRSSSSSQTVVKETTRSLVDFSEIEKAAAILPPLMRIQMLETIKKRRMENDKVGSISSSQTSESSSAAQKEVSTLSSQAAEDREKSKKYNTRGVKKSAEGNFTGALNDFIKSHKLNPDSETHYHLGLAFMGIEGFAIALQHLKEAQRLRLIHPKLQENIAKCQLGLIKIKIQQAIDNLIEIEEYTSVNEVLGPIYLLRAVFYAAIDDYEEGLKDLLYARGLGIANLEETINYYQTQVYESIPPVSSSIASAEISQQVLSYFKKAIDKTKQGNNFGVFDDMCKMLALDPAHKSATEIAVQNIANMLKDCRNIEVACYLYFLQAFLFAVVNDYEKALGAFKKSKNLLSQGFDDVISFFKEKVNLSAQDFNQGTHPREHKAESKATKIHSSSVGVLPPNRVSHPSSSSSLETSAPPTKTQVDQSRVSASSHAVGEKEKTSGCCLTM